MFMEGLGRLFDIGVGFVPVDLNTAGATGKRCNLAKASGAVALITTGVSGGSEDITLTVSQHTAYTGGTTSNLATVDHYYVKSEATLDNDESWVKVTQAASQTVTLLAATYATLQTVIAIPISADSLSDGYGWFSVSAADPGSSARLAACLYILHDLHIQRAPANLGNLLNPGAANV